MRMTPLDIQNHRFPTRWKGYDPAEVDGFLELLAQDYESLVHEVEFLRETVRNLEGRVNDLQANEGILRETLITAQAMAEDLKKTATKEAEITLGEAEVRAEKVLDAAHRRAAKLAEDIREMKALRSRLAGAVRETIQTHLTLLEGLGAPDAEDTAEEKIAYLTPTPRAPKGEAGDKPRRRGELAG
jgi:cell division initiation protein